VKSQKIHIHFGAGKLGIGAVLPVFAPDLNLVVVQQARELGKPLDKDDINWDSIGRQGRVLLSNSSRIKLKNREIAPYREWFRCLRKSWSESVLKESELNINLPEPLLLVVDHFTQVAPILGVAAQLSCSLGGGQKSLGELLADSRHPSSKAYILAFENQIEGNLKTYADRTRLKKSVDWPVYPVITDRICSDRKPKDGGRAIWAQCEEYLKVIAPQHAANCFDSALTGANKPVHLVPAEDLYFHVEKKRALVNSLHQLLALFCFRALSEHHIPTEGQYLPLGMAWFAKEYPHLHHSVELYARLRALKLVWPLVQVAPDKDAKLHIAAAKRYYGVDQPQQLYDILCKEADDAIKRFQQASDELRRLINPENLRKELKKFDEHVLKPTDFVRLNERDIRKNCPLYDKPNTSDLRALEGVLSESFLIAMDEAMGSPKKRGS
jgi:hypothetical protein